MKKIILTLVTFVAFSTNTTAADLIVQNNMHDSVEQIKCKPSPTNICIPGIPF